MTDPRGIPVWAVGATAGDVRKFRPSMAGDVGHDLRVQILPGDQTLLDRIVSWWIDRRVMVLMPVVGLRRLSCGVRIAMPDTLWCEVRARSSTSRRKLQILGGTIDSQYTGELFTMLHNFGFRPRLIEHGERYAQVVFFNAIRPSINELASVRIFEEQTERTHKRGTKGFGSTGV